MVEVFGCTQHPVGVHIESYRHRMGDLQRIDVRVYRLAPD